MVASSGAVTESPHVLLGDSVSKLRLSSALFVGTVLSIVAALASQLIPSILLDWELVGPVFALVGLLQLILGVGAVAIGLSIARLKFQDVGFTTEGWRSDVLIGATIAIVFALLQFLVIIPNTGGAARSDIAVHIAQIGGSNWGIFGFVALAWTSVFYEELFFRGLFFTIVRELLGKSRLALVGAVLVTVVFFGLLHGYQGWAGVVDTGLYGGLTLTLLYLWRGRLTACIVAHALWNTLASVLVYWLYL